MKRLFFVTFITGLLMVALATAVWPLPRHQRFRSLTAVPPDGGRQEDFIIHWPEDRIARPGESSAELPAAAVVGATVLEDSAGRRVSAELFRLRDSEDNVIGVATRVAGTGGAIADPGRSSSNWLLVIPSRGALFLAQTDAQDTTAREQSTASGIVAIAPGATAGFWTDRSPFRVTATSPAMDGSTTTGRVLRGTNEFTDLDGTFSEVWKLDEASAAGATRGSIVLSTLTVAGG
jgi:hypothetical protein